MTTFRHRVIGAGLASLHATGLHRLAAPWTRGAGAVLTFHRVAADDAQAFSPNRLLAIAPAFLDELLTHVRRAGYRIVRMDEILPLLRAVGGGQPFLALTFDDGYRDTLTAALPILERHQAPFTVFATTGFLDRTARLWWVELERALAALAAVRVEIGGRPRHFRTGSAAEKTSAFASITRELLKGDDVDLLAAVAQISYQAHLSPTELVDELCMDWTELLRLADHPLASIGCHMVSHPRLARLTTTEARNEMAAARQALEARLGQAVRHICYPYGGPSAAGAREFAIAGRLGFASGVTTRPGVLATGHAETPEALPRISVNGLFQSVGALDVLLSGLGSAIWNGARLPALSAASRSGRPAPST